MPTRRSTSTAATAPLALYEHAAALARTPFGRLTTPTDVARAIVAFSHSSTYWMTGNVLGVDGGEDIVG